MWLFVEPLDVLLFREAKPFAADEAHRATTRFPPLPTPFVGAIRSKILAEKGVDFQEFANGRDPQLRALLGTDKLGDYGGLQVKGPFLARKKAADGQLEVYFPAPRDAVQSVIAGSGVRLEPADRSASGLLARPPAACSSQAALLCSVGQAAGELEPCALDLSRFADYLTGSTFRTTSIDELCDIETRLGIELDHDSRTARSGRLYMAELARLRKDRAGEVGFLLEITTSPEVDSTPIARALGTEGMLALGGEQRGARYEVVHDGQDVEWATGLEKGLDELREKVREGLDSRLRVCLAAPAVFSQGWLPDFIDPGTLETKVGSPLWMPDGHRGPVNLRLISAAVGKPVPLGGWDLARGEPKPMFRAVPAGSVYFFELLEGRVDDVMRVFHFTCGLQHLAESLDEPHAGNFAFPSLAQAGFGLSFVGAWGDPLGGLFG